MSATPQLLDAPGTVCRMGKSCTRLMLGAGGFDQHHPWPLEFGGPQAQIFANLCPNHHRRQHALIRYLYDCGVGNMPPEWIVTRRFSPAERKLAVGAIDALRRTNHGTLPAISGWPAPAARAL